MPRKPRSLQVIPGLPHHVVIRGNNRRRLFSYPRDYQLYLRFLLKAREKYAVEVHQVTLMSNHGHLIVIPQSVQELSHFMGHANQRYATVRNGSRDGSGKLYEERFDSKPIRSSEQLVATMAYNDTNAYDAGIVDDPFNHRWSTVRLHAGVQPVEPSLAALWTPSAWYLGLGTTHGERTATYRSVIESYLEAKAASKSADSPPGRGQKDRYTRRLERPDRSRASEASTPYDKVRG